MDTIGQIVRYAIVVALMIPMLGIALIVAPFSRNVSWRIYKSWCQISLRLFGVEVESRFEGDASQLDRGGVIIGLTQQSLIDPTAGYAGWSHRILSIWNIEYALIPFFGWATVFLGWIIVRQNPGQAKGQLHKAADHAAKGGLVYLSAEGQRSIDGALNPYKKGPVVLAIKSQAPIHPLYIAGSRACLPVGDWKIRPGKVVMYWLAPISTSGLTYEDRDALLEQVRSIGESQHKHWQEKSRSTA